MSSGSPRRSRSQTRTVEGCTVIPPQPVTDPTILDSVAGFISEVATYNAPPDNKDQIQWARFEQLDNHVLLDSVTGDKSVTTSLLLVLGYATGMQVWAIPSNGEAVDILSWRHGSVRVLRFLPTPYKVGCEPSSDLFAESRPLMALCDPTAPTPPPHTVSLLSLKTGEQVRVLKFKNPIIDVLANRRCIVITFLERIAIFNAFTLESQLAVTTCYISPGINTNPIALGARWLAYAERKLIAHKRSSGGNEGEGVQSYKATVLQAAKSLGKGLRELGETVASSLTGNHIGASGAQILGNITSDGLEKGIITILDTDGTVEGDNISDNIVVHFPAHSDAIVSILFDPSGLLLLTADKRGHDFHVFRINPHPVGSQLAAVHHLYILHRGDTTAKVQDMCFSPDSRWAAISTLRGTTHVFPITPYGGNVGNRTHASPHVVNKMSRFHRSAGLAADGRCNSPISNESPPLSNLPYSNPRLPPYPQPTIINPLAQIRQPIYLSTSNNSQQRSHPGRQRLNSASEDGLQVALRLCACFAPPRAWFDNMSQPHDILINKQMKQVKSVESLFIMSCHGSLLQYDLDPHPTANIPKDKRSDETPIELTVQAKAEWILQRELFMNDVPLPITSQNLKLLPQDDPSFKSAKPSHTDAHWLSQVEIITHAGPHRRLWMGPQFSFKTYNTDSGSLNDAQPIDVGRSKPVNMPVSTTYPILIESGSASSCEQSPKLADKYHRFSEEISGPGELQLKEDLADAMLESPGDRESGGRCVVVSMKPHSVAKVVNPLGTVVTVHSDEDDEVEVIEDSLIHENCDEALFRPVVAPKTFLFTENKTRKTIRPTVRTISEVKEKGGKEKKAVDNGKKLKTVDLNIMSESLSPKPTKIKTEPLKSNNTVEIIKKPIEQPPVVPKRAKTKLKIVPQEVNEEKFDSGISSFSNKSDFDVSLPIISTPDLMDNVDDFDYSNDPNPNKITTKIEDVVKEEKFEDARDTADEIYNTLKESKIKLENEPNEIIFVPEDDKTTTKKPRKPKTKLGVRLSKGKDNVEKMEKEMDTSVEVITPAPKKAWSSVVAKREEDTIEILDVDFNVEIPKKSYSTAAKHNLFEIDPNEDLYDSDILFPEKLSFKDKKADVKLSDDEKNVSSQNETTESDDSTTKITAMDTEEDNCQQEITKNVQNEKSAKRKSKKKKR